MSIVDEALEFHTSKRAQRGMNGRFHDQRAIPGNDPRHYYTLRRVARTLAKAYMKMVVRLDGEAEKVRYLTETRFAFEREVDRLEAENKVLRELREFELKAFKELKELHEVQEAVTGVKIKKTGGA